MKIINHNDGNYHFVSHGDSSVMYGSIYMTRKEYKDAVAYLKRVKRTTKDSYIEQNLSVSYPKIANIFCLGVTATELIFKHYKLPRYKRQNYSINIIKA